MIGKTVSRYSILSQLGSGGMGVIYKAEDTVLGRQVALKFLPEEVSKNREVLERFRREAIAASSFNHPNICTIHDVGDYEGQPYIVMELLTGLPLQRYLAGQPLKVDVLLDLSIQVTSALIAAHSAGVVHRDIKPSNIFVSKSRQAKVLDFGLAKLMPEVQKMNSADEPTDDHLTNPGTVMGTVSYMSPEQVLGRTLDGRSDIFSFGVVMYQMATATQPFSGETWTATANEIVNGKQPPAIRLNPDLHPKLSEIINKALDKDRDRRYQTASDLRSDLALMQSDTAAGTSSFSSTGYIAAADEPSIVVLPFVDLSMEKDQEYFCEGMAEELINRLSQLAGLRVVSRTSAFSLRGKNMDIKTIGAQLNVDTVLEGSVRKAGNRFRITAQLVNSFNGFHMWSERYDREIDDLFAVQDEIAQSIVGNLKLALAAVNDSVLVRRYTDNIEAYNLYLKGLYYWNRRFEGEVVKAIECFQEAIDLDSSYALAHAGLADCYTQLGGYSLLPPEFAASKARPAADTAIRLDPNLAEALTAAAVVKLFFDWDWQGAEQGFRQALEVNPKFGLARHYLSLCLSYVGRFKEAVEEIRYAQKLDPVSLIINATVGLVLYYARRYDEALEECDKALEIEPYALIPVFVRGAVCAAKGMPDEAIAGFEQASKLAEDKAFWFALVGYGHAVAGNRRRAEEVIETLKNRSDNGTEYIDPIVFAWIYAGLGELDLAFEWFDRAHEAGSCELMLTKVLPAIDSIRSDLRYDVLLGRIGLPLAQAY